MKVVVAAFNQEKALVGAFSVITNLRMELFEALVWMCARIRDAVLCRATVPSITVSLDSGLDVDHEEVVTAPELAREVDLELEDETAETEEDELPFRCLKLTRAN